MARSLSTGMAAAVGADTGAYTHLILLTTSDGIVRFTTGATDISWGGETWTALGGALIFSQISETSDRRGQGVQLTLSGVDQTIVNLLLTYNIRGREAKIYLAHIDTDGTIIADPYPIFIGYLNERWDIKEKRGTGDDTVTVTTRIVSTLAALQLSNPVRANIYSHREMIRRSGATSAALGDTFFTFLPKLLGKPIFWGSKNPYIPDADTIYTGRTAKRR